MLKYSLSAKQTKTEVLSGLTVALALVPEAVAFALVAQVNPLVGLYAAFIVGLITSALGGRPGMISGATGALAVVMVSLVVSHGVEYLFATVVLMGLIQMLVGLFKLGKLIRIVPHSVMLGFVNGLAIVIFLAQLGQFKVESVDGTLVWLENNKLYLMLGLVLLTMFVIEFFPKITKAIPSPLAGILIVFAVTEFFQLDVRNVGDMANIAGGFPEFKIPDVPLNWETLQIILPYSFVLAAIGLIESLLALTLIDEMTETHGRNSRECAAQGASNVVSGFFGAMGGCAMIGQSMINITSGARHRLSGIVASLFLLSFILFAAPLIERIPLAALIGVMFVVVYKTFAWSSLRLWNKIPKSDFLVIVLVSIVTVFYDLAVAVFVGVIVSALVYAWESSQHITAVVRKDAKKGEKIYEVYGSLFFGSVVSFKELFHPKDDPQNVIIDFEHSRVWDHSGLEALERLYKKYQANGKNITFKRLSPDCAKLLEKAGNSVEVDEEKDPKYEVVMDRIHEPGSKDVH